MVKINTKDLCTKETYAGKVPVVYTTVDPNNQNIFQVVMSRVESYPAGLEIVMEIIRSWDNKSVKISFMSSLPIYI